MTDRQRQLVSNHRYTGGEREEEEKEEKKEEQR